jgi:hypothetical protein
MMFGFPLTGWWALTPGSTSWKLLTHFNYCSKTECPRKKSEDIVHETNKTHHREQQWTAKQVMICSTKQCNAKCMYETTVWGYLPFQHCACQYQLYCTSMFQVSGLKDVGSSATIKGPQINITWLFAVGSHKGHHICQMSWQSGRSAGQNHNDNSNSGSCIAD